MFSQDQIADRVVCLADYGRVTRGAIVPVSNELYADVEQWIAEGNALAAFTGYPDTRTLEDAKTARREFIEQARIAATDSGFDYDFGGAVDRVQTRPEDRENLLGLESEAHNLKADGETGAVIPFRAESNAEYNLTPDEMIAVSRAALAHKQAQYQTSWGLKAQISAASTIADADAVAWPSS